MTKDNVHPLVSICCITYNHEKYVKDALGGFLMQKTNFPVEVVISEDCSTDDTRNVLNEHKEKFDGKLTLHLNDQNLGVIGNLSFTLSACKGKYIALCEGDDYWTDPLKLQKQVDFMEAHPECSLSCHKVLVDHEDQPEKNHIFPDLEGDQVFSRDEMYLKYISATCSVMFRAEKINELVAFLEGFKVGDMPIYSFYLQYGKFGYIDQVMAVYRKNKSSYWYPNYEKLRFPVLFDTFTKIKTNLNIKDSKPMDAQISFYGDELLKKYYAENDFPLMRQTIHKIGTSIFSAKKHRKRRFVIYLLIAYFPFLYKAYRQIKPAQNQN